MMLLALRVLTMNILCLAGMGVSLCHAQATVIEGNISGIGDKPIQIWYVQNGKRAVDTVYAKGDRFKYRAKMADDSTVKIYVKSPFLTTVWLGPGTVTVTGSLQNASRLVVSGGIENDLAYQYQSGIDWAYQDLMAGKPDSLKFQFSEQKRHKTLSFVRQHLNSRMAADLLYWETMYDESAISLYDSLLKQFTPQVLGSKQGLKLRQRLEVVKKQPVAGKQAPLFSISDQNGQLVSLSDFKGKYVLLDFWGHWCGPCVKAFPALKAFQDRYSGKIQLLGIAAEDLDDRGKWLQMIKTNNLNWVQLSEFQSDKGPVNSSYAITAFPTYFLLDKSGIIISKSNSLYDIQRAVDSIAALN